MIHFLLNETQNNIVKYQAHYRVFMAVAENIVTCGGLPSMCPSQTQDPLADQGKHITRLRSLRLDQDKLRLAPEVRSFPSSTMSNGMSRPSQLTFQTGSRCQTEWTDQVGWTF